MAGVDSALPPLALGVLEAAAGEALPFPFVAVLLGETFDFGVALALALVGDFCDLAGVALAVALGVVGFTGEAFFLDLTDVFLTAAALGVAGVAFATAGAASFLAFFTGTYTKEYG